MGRPLMKIVLFSFFFSLIVGARTSIYAQQSPQANDKERGIELYSKGNFSEAVKALKEAVKKQQGDIEAWYYLGLSSHGDGKIKDARKAFEKTLSLNPDFARGYAAVAYMQLLSNDNQGAVKNAEKALALDPKSVESLYIAGMARLREGAPAVALARAEDALKIKPDYPEAFILKTQALINMFSQSQANLSKSPGRLEEGKSTGEANGEVRKRSDYSLLKEASESLEAYLKLTPDQSEQALWREQLEGLRIYARMAPGSNPDTSVTGITPTLRPTILYREKARYTDAARNAGVRGTVVLMVVFADDGVVKHILAIQPLSHGLTEEAIRAAHKIRFTPAMRDGKPISLIGMLEFTFNMY